jgi:AraC-like DNA-binding protein
MSIAVLDRDDTGGVEHRMACEPAYGLEVRETRRARVFRYWYARNLPGIEAVSVSGIPAGWSELHETFTVCTVERGAPVPYRCRSRSLARCPRVGMLVGPGQLHTDQTEPGPSAYRILRIAPRAITRAATRLGLSSANLTVAEHDIPSAATNELFLSLHIALESGIEGAAIHRLVDACVGEIVRRCTTKAVPAVERRDVRRAREFIRDNLHEPLTLADVAAAAGRGRWGFSALFRDQVGLPPHQYIVQMRLARARTLLAMGRPCGDVALEVGFFDQSHLNRWFGRAYGVSPGEYQRTLLESVTSPPSHV